MDSDRVKTNKLYSSRLPSRRFAPFAVAFVPVPKCPRMPPPRFAPECPGFWRIWKNEPTAGDVFKNVQECSTTPGAAEKRKTNPPRNPSRVAFTTAKS